MIKKIICMVTIISITLTTVVASFASEISPDGLNQKEKFDYISEQDIPSFISYSELSNDGMVARVKSEETDLMTAVFADADNNRTRYVFSQPIKYENNGKIEDIDNSIIDIKNPTQAENGYLYKNKSNDVKTLFPQTLSKNTNIKIVYDNYEIVFSPVTEYTSSATKSTNSNATDTQHDVIYYQNAFGQNTSLRYSPNYAGLKEDIILDKYNGNNVFEFKLILKDVHPLCNGESIALLNDDDEIVSVIGQVDATDSYSGKNTDNHFTLNNKTSLIATQTSNEYIIKIEVDKDFLSNPATVYPVVVDPNVSINKTYHKDTTVYSNKTTTNFWSSSYNNVGNHGSSYGTAIAFVQFDLSSFENIPNDGITSAIYRVYEGSGKTNSSTINVRQPSSTWVDTSLKWNNKPAISTTNIASKVISKSGYYEFEIKNLIKSYIKNVRGEGGADPKRGFAMVASNSNDSSKHFCSAQHGTYPPVLKIAYSNYQLLGMRWSSRNCKFRINSLPTAFQNGVRTAITDWNSKNINFSFSVDNSTSNGNTITTKSSGMTSGTVAYCEYS